jgi:energy-converting hydrogenase Eha subunit B
VKVDLARMIKTKTQNASFDIVVVLVKAVISALNFVVDKYFSLTDGSIIENPICIVRRSYDLGC